MMRSKSSLGVMERVFQRGQGINAGLKLHHRSLADHFGQDGANLRLVTSQGLSNDAVVHAFPFAARQTRQNFLLNGLFCF